MLDLRLYNKLLYIIQFHKCLSRWILIPAYLYDTTILFGNRRNIAYDTDYDTDTVRVSILLLLIPRRAKPVALDNACKFLQKIHVLILDGTYRFFSLSITE